MNVVVLNWRDVGHPDAGGAEIVVDRQCSAVGKAGHNVTLLTAAYPGADNATRGKYFDTLRRGGPLSIYIRLPSLLRRRWRELEPDLVIEHINGVPWFTPLWASARVLACVYHLVGRIFFEQLPFPLSAAGYVAEASMPSFYRDSPVVCLGQAARKEFQSLGFPSGQLTIIQPGVDHNVYKPGVAKSDFPLIVMPGPLKRYKRHDVAIKAIHRLIPEFPNLRLVIFGHSRGSMKFELQNLVDELGIQRWVSLAGYLGEDEKVRLLQGAWANLYCSSAEGWGLGVLEAAACGTPSVVPAVGGLQDAVENGVSGVIFRPEGIESLVDCLRKVLVETTYRERLSGGALSLSKEFSWSLYDSKVVRLVEGFATATK